MNWLYHRCQTTEDLIWNILRQRAGLSYKLNFDQHFQWLVVLCTTEAKLLDIFSLTNTMCHSPKWKYMYNHRIEQTQICLHQHMKCDYIWWQDSDELNTMTLCKPSLHTTIPMRNQISTDHFFLICNMHVDELGKHKAEPMCWGSVSARQINNEMVGVPKR